MGGPIIQMKFVQGSVLSTSTLVIQWVSTCEYRKPASGRCCWRPVGYCVETAVEGVLRSPQS